MRPDQLSRNLHRLATSIESAKRPSRAKVARQLRKFVAALGDGPIEAVVKSPELATVEWVNRYFDGDADAATRAEHEAYAVIERNTGCKMVDNEAPGEVYFSCPNDQSLVAFRNFIDGVLSERPDDQVDLFLGLLGSNIQKL